MRLAEEIEAEASKRRWAPLLQLHPVLFTPRGMRRFVHYVIGSIVLIPCLHLLLTPLGFTHWKIQIGLAAAFGIIVGVTRPRGVAVGLLLAGTALATMWRTGHVRHL